MPVSIFYTFFMGHIDKFEKPKGKFLFFKYRYRPIAIRGVEGTGKNIKNYVHFTDKRENRVRNSSFIGKR